MKADAGIDHQVEVDKRKAALVEIVGHGVRVVVGQETCGSRLVRLEICHGAAVGQEVAVDPEKKGANIPEIDLELVDPEVDPELVDREV